MSELDDLYRVFAERRRTRPVWPESVAPATGPGVTVYRYEDCARVLRDAATFSSSGYSQSIDLVMGRTILSMDDPDHKRYRDLVAHAFLQKALAEWGTDVMTAICTDLIDRFRPDGRADLVKQFANEFPLRVITRMLGLPPEDAPQFERWSTELIGIADDIDAGLLASVALRDYFAGVVAERRRELRDDLISDLVAAEIDGERLDDESIYSFLRLLLPAGVETTTRAIPSLLHRLLSHPEQLHAVAADRRLVGPAIEESLRLDVPVVYVARVATTDADIDGVPVPAGSFVTVCLASANRDELRWKDPDRFDVHRPYQQHLAFAVGAHMCLGQQLARMEETVALNSLLDRLPNLGLDPDAPAPGFLTSNAGSMPALDSLPVRFDT